MVRPLRFVGLLALFTTLTSFAAAQFSMPVSEPKFILATNPKVQDHLKLTAEQKSKIRSVLEGIMEDDGNGRTMITLNGSTSLDDLDKDVLSALDASQLKRFDQLYCQNAGYLALSREEYAKPLKLSEEQVKQLDAAWEAYQGRLMDFMSSNGPGSTEMHATTEQIAKIRLQTKEEVDKILTPEQIKLWDASLGEKFEFEKDKDSI
ncbi:MAG: hypothetical protein JNM34_04080 [Chthonomonadaceae bacterium]|nr:hypothetical protein [Chthonomonadaceae bacterium]